MSMTSSAHANTVPDMKPVYTNSKSFAFYGAVFSKAGLLDVLYGVGNLGKFWSVCGLHDVKYTESSMNKYTYKYMHNCACGFVNR
jgi:isocitrate lyase